MGADSIRREVVRISWIIFVVLALPLPSIAAVEGVGDSAGPASTIARLAVPGPQAGRSPTPSPPEIRADGYTSARVCGQCHADIYESWKNSLHAFSLTDPIFDTAYMQAVKEAGDDARRLCLRCHAPMTIVTGDLALEQGVTREGVSCDFCHTVTAVSLDGGDRPYELEPGLVKRSVLRYAESPAHRVAYSELHGRSEFCGGCHNYLAPSGSPIMGTYQEWREGPYAAEGVQCQECHMVRSAGEVVAGEIMDGPDQIHLHDLIHDTDQLRSAVEVEIVSVARRGDSVDVELAVENVGSGHMVPTGLPTRELVLTVAVEGRGSTWDTAERRYRKVVGDDRGRPLDSDWEVLLRGSRVLNDNRIRPRERRVERFVLDAPASGNLKVTATVSYRYSPVVLREQRMDIELGRSEEYVR